MERRKMVRLTVEQAGLAMLRDLVEKQLRVRVFALHKGVEAAYVRGEPEERTELFYRKVVGLLTSDLAGLFRALVYNGETEPEGAD